MAGGKLAGGDEAGARKREWWRWLVAMVVMVLGQLKRPRLAHGDQRGCVGNS